MKKHDERNQFQIIRKDAKNCFVESKSDWFGKGQAHLEFATYDTKQPEGQRQTNHIHIFIALPEFLSLTQEALCGILHGRMQQSKANKDGKALYESMGGTSASLLNSYGRPRTDGMSLSRIVKIYAGEKNDYLIVADSGSGQADAKGLIVPRFGKTPENHVSISMSWRSLNELLLMTKIHYEAWLTSQYVILANGSYQ